MTPLTQEQLLELASGYALGALSPEETAAVEAALPGNAALAAEVQAFRETMGAMLSAEVPMTPRASLRDEWLQRVREGRREPDVVPIRTATAAPRERSRRIPAVLAIAALAASFVGVVFLGGRLQRVQQRLEVAMAAQAERERQLNTLLEAEGNLMVAVLDTHNEHGTGVQFFWNVRQQRGMVHAFHLPPAPKGRAYQVWVTRGAVPISVRVFDSEPGGHALVENLQLPKSADGITAVAITVEPEGGSALPTSTPIMQGELQQRTSAVVSR